MVEVTDAAMIRKAIEDMPYLDWTTECEETDEIIPLTLRQFYEGTWQGAYADELFTAVERVIAEVLTSVTASTYERGKLEGARLALEAAAKDAEEWFPFDTSKRYPSFGVVASIRALSPAKIVGEG